MRIAFYAPMKPPTSPRPSGDRRMARLLMRALGEAGHSVLLASSFRSWQGAPDRTRQERLARVGHHLAGRLVRRWRACRPETRPDLWFTYHVYYKAPDWIGPMVAGALGIPYIVAEASHAPKHADGPWAVGHAATERAIRHADALIGFNPLDSACLAPLLADAGRLTMARPFLDAAPFAAAARNRTRHRRAIVAEFNLAPDVPTLLAVAMMRPGDKLASYRILAGALRSLNDLPWQLLVVGAGAARPDVEAALAPIGHRVCYAGERDSESLAPLYAAADLFVWPAVHESYGMAILEAQATGLPVIAGRTEGVASIVRNSETGVLTPEGDAGAFAAAVRALLSGSSLRRTMGENALRAVRRDHDIGAAARMLDGTIARAAAGRRAA